MALRLFEENEKRWQKSVKDLNLEILCVSQFTLYHRLKGNKPDFSAAMKGEEAQQLYNHFLDRLGKSYDPSKIKGNLRTAINISNLNVFLIRWKIWSVYAGAYRKRRTRDH